MSDSKSIASSESMKALLVEAMEILAELRRVPETEDARQWRKKVWRKALTPLNTLVGLKDQIPDAVEPLCALFLRSRYHEVMLAGLIDNSIGAAYQKPDLFRQIYFEPDIKAHTERHQESQPGVGKAVSDYNAWREKHADLCADATAILEPVRHPANSLPR